MLTIHHLRLSQSERIVWLAEELEIPYQIKIYNRRQDNQLAPDDYKSLHPMGIAPVVTDKGFVLAESGAIMDWMIGTFGASELVPDPESPDYATHLFFYHWANATFMTNGMMALVAQFMGASEIPSFVADRTTKSWNLIEDHLGNAKYFGGSRLSLADIMMGFQLTTSRVMSGMKIDHLPNLRQYLQRIGDRPAYQRAMAKCEPGMPPKLD